MFGCFTTTRGWIVLGLAGLAGGYLAFWHGAHLAAALPFLVILACPLMHLFMHRGHGQGDSHRSEDAS
jgi:Flp pilus assembly protein TadB